MSRKPVQEFENRQTRPTKHIWENPNSFATTLVTLLIDTFGTEAATWAPETISLEIRDEAYSVLPAINIDKLMAGIMLITSDEFYVSLPVFNELCIVLNGGYMPMHTTELASVEDCAWGITEALLLSPPEDPDSFSADIKAYIGKALKNEGIIQAPPILGFAAGEKNLADKVNYDFSDDEDLFTDIWQAEKDKTNDIDKYIKQRLQSLLIQIVSLPLMNGSTKELTKKLAKMYD